MGTFEIAVAGGDTGAPLNLEKRLRLIAEHVAPGRSRVLDCGCGRGEYVVALRRRYELDARGVEYLAEKVADFVRAHPGEDWVSRGDLERLELPDADFDVAYLNEVLEHVPDDAAALREIHRILRPGGTLLVFSPNRLFPFETHGVFWRDTDRRIPPWVPLIPYVPLALGRRIFRYWARNYWPRELRRLVEGAGFEIVGSTYLWQTFENISGTQPAPIRALRPLLRRLAAVLEATPLLRRFGASQVIVAEKRPLEPSPD